MYSYFVTNDIGAEGVVMVGVVRQASHFAMSAEAFGRRIRTPHSIIIATAMIGIVSLLIVIFIFAFNMKAQHRQQSSAQVNYESSTISRPSSALDTKSESEILPASSTNESRQSSTVNKTPVVHTDVSVNGKSVPLPADGNGSVHKVITSNRGGKTSVDITVKTNSSSSTASSSNLDLNLNVESSQSSVYNSE